MTLNSTTWGHLRSLLHAPQTEEHWGRCWRWLTTRVDGLGSAPVREYILANLMRWPASHRVATTLPRKEHHRWLWEALDSVRLDVAFDLELGMHEELVAHPHLDLVNHVRADFGAQASDLRRVAMVYPRVTYDEHQWWTRIFPGLEEVVRGLPRMHTLEVTMHTGTTRPLQYYGHSLSSPMSGWGALASMAEALLFGAGDSRTHLTRVSLRGDTWDDEALKRFARTPYFSSLRYLTLEQSRYTAQGLRALSRATWAGQLETFTLDVDEVEACGRAALKALAYSPHLAEAVRTPWRKRLRAFQG